MVLNEWFWHKCLVAILKHYFWLEYRDIIDILTFIILVACVTVSENYIEEWRYSVIFTSSTSILNYFYRPIWSKNWQKSTPSPLKISFMISYIIYIYQYQLSSTANFRLPTIICRRYLEQRNQFNWGRDMV